MIYERQLSTYDCPESDPQIQMNIHELIQQRIEGSIDAIDSVRQQVDTLASIANATVDCFRAGNTLYTAGNGGSAAQAMHLAEELIGRYRSNRMALPAICLNTDSTALTCIANDFGFDQVFARQCEGLIKPGDVLLVLSTSGNSPNIINALQAAKERGAIVIGLLGKDGGRCLGLCDHAIVVCARNNDTAFIQEAHQVVIHLVCEAVERAFQPE